MRKMENRLFIGCLLLLLFLTVFLLLFVMYFIASFTSVLPFGSY